MLAAGLDSRPTLPPNLRTLFIYGTADATVVKSAVERAKKFIKEYQELALEGQNHWLMVDAKDEVTEKIANWLEDLTCLNLDRKAHL